MTQPQVACVGNVCVDLYLHGLAAWPGRGERAVVGEAVPTVGGNAMNVAVLLARLGVPSHLIAMYADDSAGTRILSRLDEHGVSCDRALCEVRSSEGNFTAQSLVQLDPDGESRFVYMSGAGSLLDATVLGRWLDTHGGEVNLLHLSAIGIVPCLAGEALGDLLRRTRSRWPGLRISLDVSLVADRTSDEWAAALQPVLPFVDYFMPNLSEARQILGDRNPVSHVDADALSAARRLKKLTSEDTTVIIKLGADGCLLLNPDGGEARIPVEPAAVVDSTGAGDAWCAGFIANLLKTDFASVHRAASNANRVARMCVSHRGAHDFDIETNDC